jgi:hypothetical protein
MQILGQPMSSKIKSSLRGLAAGLFCAAAGLCAHAQAGNPPRAFHPVQPVSVSPNGAGSGAAVNPVPAAAGGRALDTAAKPATVVLQEGKLKIDTDNSDLSEILRDVARVSGMTVDGNVKSIRIFGVYGPGIPGDVLTDLLAGSGYNFMMVGKLGDGAPRELLLSEKSGGPPSAGARPRAVSSDDDDSNAPDDEPGPGAVMNAPPPPSQDPQERMQQNMQRLQQQREQMQQQQQQQPNPPQ